MNGSSGTKKGKAPQYAALYPNENGGKIPYYSKIGTKLIVGFLVIASISGSVGYLSFNYSLTVGAKFHELALQTIPVFDSLKEIKVAALSIEASTQEYVLSTDLNRDRFLQEINIQKDDLKTNLKKYTDLVNKYFPLQIFRRFSGSKNKQTELSMKIKVSGVCSSTCEASYSTGALNLTRELI